jgi:hypothetical protein
VAVMALERSPRETMGERRSPRLIALGFVAALHLGFAVFLLASLTQHPRALLVTPREMFFLFAPRPARIPKKIEPPVAVLKKSAPLFRYVPSTAIALPPPVRDALGASLFGCAPENLANLPAEDRARCAGAFPLLAFDTPPPEVAREQAEHAQRWRAALEARNAPLAVPCASAQRVQDPAPGQAASAAMLDPLCVLPRLAAAVEPGW